MSRCGTQFAISIDELKELANGQIHAIAQFLLPNGRENCGYWEVGSIEGEPGKSLKVNLRGATRGLWTDFSAAPGTPSYSGNVIQLAAQVRFAGDVGRACQWLRSWLGIDKLDPDRFAQEKARRAGSGPISRPRQARRAIRATSFSLRRKCASPATSAAPVSGSDRGSE